MENNLMYENINKKLMNDIGGIVGKTISEAFQDIINEFNELKQKNSDLNNKTDSLGLALKKDKLESSEKFSELEKDIDVNSQETKKIKNMTYVLRNDTEGKMIKLKKKCKARIRHMVGSDKSGYKYILFYDCYLSNIYSDIKNSLGMVNTLGDISIDDYDLAMTLADRWFPKDYIINKHINDLLKLRDKSKLSIAKEKSLDEYLENLHNERK